MGISKALLKGRKWIRLLLGSISFYPALITFLFMVIAIALDSTLLQNLDLFILEKAPFITTTDPSTTRTLLGSMIGGLMTLTVFSFTMVMVLLNQASSMYSPRLLPGLVSNRRHQIVLGIYLGTLIYSIVLLIGIRGLDDTYTLPHTAIAGALFFMGLSVAAFVYFIHSISTSIQIDVIINNLYKRVLDDTSQYSAYINDNNTHINGNESQTLRCSKSGYVIGWNINELMTICQAEKIVLALHVDQGDFVLRGDICAIANQVLTAEVSKKIYDSLLIEIEQVDRAPAEQSVQHLLEIAMKAMSPGINDPLTALSAIERLTFVLEIAQGRADERVHDIEGKPILIECFKPYDLLLEDTMLGLREYCTDDPLVYKSVFRMLTHLTKCKGAVRKGKNIPGAELALLGIK